MSMYQTRFALGDRVVDKVNYYTDDGVIKSIPDREGRVTAIELTDSGIYCVVEGRNGKWKSNENRLSPVTYTTTRNITSRTS